MKTIIAALALAAIALPATTAAQGRHGHTGDDLHA